MSFVLIIWQICLYFSDICEQMNKKKKSSVFFNYLNERFRFVIIADNTLKERLSLRLSRLNSFIVFVSCSLLLLLFLLLIIVYSPLKEYIPGKSRLEVQKNLLDLRIQIDSLELELKTQDLYLENINAIIRGEKLNENSLVLKKDSVISSTEEIIFKKSTSDSLLRSHVESEETGVLFNNSRIKSNGVVFFKPVIGMISDTYNKQTKHFGVDIVAKKNSPINSVLDGTIIISHWSSSNGYVIGVQHENNFISIYKHNSLLLKNVGDLVLAGEKIAVIGNSGEFSSGPHLHFELWNNGAPVDPEIYIKF